MPKATMSRDGMPRINMLIKTRFDHEDITEILACHMHKNKGELPDGTSRRTILKIVRDSIERLGREHFYYWSDGMDGDDDEHRERAAQLVRFRFPDLFTGGGGAR
ncbi:hypothetical protein EV193_104352 [Herbihabitans rhizosphaerae]|uniref:Uncharacterized protein n=1 Tax=Herbihabitans rhizosphaerae TaxID=1872711 RepID=A0A4Q7KRU8_9PSEU|nr:hypothetical protein [Herbihabitans rhizosphaerae]RZS39136.1 hypothetical protein EV193_104352 [Herbihabitans rhizosphaerae]